MLKGWIERVFTYSFAFSLTEAGWRGDINGRVPLLKHEKALIISTTLFNEEVYRSGLEAAMKTLIDDFAFRYPGIRTVEHAYFYAVSMADDATRQRYLQRAYLLGKEFGQDKSLLVPQTQESVPAAAADGRAAEERRTEAVVG